MRVERINPVAQNILSYSSFILELNEAKSVYVIFELFSFTKSFIDNFADT